VASGPRAPLVGSRGLPLGEGVDRPERCASETAAGGGHGGGGKKEKKTAHAKCAKQGSTSQPDLPSALPVVDRDRIQRGGALVRPWAGPPATGATAGVPLRRRLSDAEPLRRGSGPRRLHISRDGRPELEAGRGCANCWPEDWNSSTVLIRLLFKPRRGGSARMHKKMSWIPPPPQRCPRGPKIRGSKKNCGLEIGGNRPSAGPDEHGPKPMDAANREGKPYFWADRMTA